MESKTCIICKKRGAFIACPKCGLKAYCTQKCRKADLKDHRQICPQLAERSRADIIAMGTSLMAIPSLSIVIYGAACYYAPCMEIVAMEGGFIFQARSGPVANDVLTIVIRNNGESAANLYYIDPQEAQGYMSQLMDIFPPNINKHALVMKDGSWEFSNGTLAARGSM